MAYVSIMLDISLNLRPPEISFSVGRKCSMVLNAKILFFGSLALEMLKKNKVSLVLEMLKKTTNLSLVLEMLDLGAVRRMSPLDRPPSPYSPYGLAI